MLIRPPTDPPPCPPPMLVFPPLTSAMPICPPPISPDDNSVNNKRGRGMGEKGAAGDHTSMAEEVREDMS